MRLSIFEWYMVAESYLAVFAEIRRGMLIFHAHVAVEFELYFFKFFNRHRFPFLRERPESVSVRCLSGPSCVSSHVVPAPSD